MNNFEQLMLAAQVRQIAVEMRETEMETAKAIDAKKGLTPNPRAWLAEHPVEEFVPKALEALRAVVAIISAHPPAK